MTEVQALIKQAVCQHLPSAAIASGFVSPVDFTAWVAQMSERFPMGSRPDTLGLTKLTAWLSEQGVVAGRAWVLALQGEWLHDRMRAACHADNLMALQHKAIR